MRLLPLTLCPDRVSRGSSPNGGTVAFMWDEGKGGPFTIYVETVGTSELRRVSVSAWGAVGQPGRRMAAGVAYLRRKADGTRRVEVSSLSPPARNKSGELPVPAMGRAELVSRRPSTRGAACGGTR